mgnify:CR=1 FL=1
MPLQRVFINGTMKSLITIMFFMIFCYGCGTPFNQISSGKLEPNLSKQNVKTASIDSELRAFLDTKLKAEAGEPLAQTKTADNYATGRGVLVNFQEAVKWYRKAAEQNEPRAQYNLGYMYYNSEALPRDYKKAVYWFTKAAKQGNSGAQCNLGLMYENGEGVEENDKIAVNWFRKAAVQGESMAQFNMGWMYENGTGVEKNAVKALAWYKKASFTGHIEAPSFLAILYDAGNGVKVDKIAAYAWWLIGAKRGDEAPLNNLDFLETKLTAQQIKTAKDLASQLEKEMANSKP